VPTHLLGNGLEEHRDETKGWDVKRIQDPNSGQRKSFQVFFLKGDDDQDVVIMETSEIDLEEVIGCLKQGDSVFIKCNSSAPIVKIDERIKIPDMIARRVACTDFVDTGKEFRIYAEIPDIPKYKLDANITKDVIEISGNAETGRKEEDKGYGVIEWTYSEVYKRIEFPEEVIPARVKANLKDGLLEIKVPKKVRSRVYDL